MSDEIRWAISDALASALPRCGECFFWMKSRDCPREHNVQGISRGPSSGDATCVKFEAKDAETASAIAERWKPADAYLRRRIKEEAKHTEKAG